MLYALWVSARRRLSHQHHLYEYREWAFYIRLILYQTEEYFLCHTVCSLDNSWHCNGQIKLTLSANIRHTDWTTSVGYDLPCTGSTTCPVPINDVWTFAICWAALHCRGGDRLTADSTVAWCASVCRYKQSVLQDHGQEELDSFLDAAEITVSPKADINFH